MRTLLRLLLVAGLWALPCPGGIQADLQTATLTLDDAGCVTSLRFADGTERSAPIGPAFCLETSEGIRLPESLRASGDTWTIPFQGGGAAELALRRHPGFVLFELKKLTSREES